MRERSTRKADPSDVSDDEWAFVAAYLTLMKEDAPQREQALREVFNGLRWIARTGSPWRWLPPGARWAPPPWHTVGSRSSGYQQTRRGLEAEVFEAMVGDPRRLLGELDERAPEPRAAILDRRTRPSSPESGARAGHDGATRRKGSKVCLAVDTLGGLLALLVTPANERDRAQTAELAERVQEATGESVERAPACGRFVEQGSTGERPADDAAAHGIRLETVKLPEAKRGLVLLPRRWVVERSNAWLARFRRLARDDERLPETLAGLHCLAFAILLLTRFLTLMAEDA